MEKIIKDYLKGEEDQCLVQLITGERGSGKTTLLMKEMKWGLDAIPHLKILFVCPVFRYESTGKYNWMLQPRYQKRVRAREEPVGRCPPSRVQYYGAVPRPQGRPDAGSLYSR